MSALTPGRLAVCDRVAAAVRDAAGPMTTNEIAAAIGTVPCGCRGRANHGGCNGTGWRPAYSVDIGSLTKRLERLGLIERKISDRRTTFVAALGAFPMLFPGDSARRKELIERLARGLDIPPEMLAGTEDPDADV